MAPQAPRPGPAGPDAAAASARPRRAACVPGPARLLRLAVAALARRELSAGELERKLRERLLPEESAQDIAPVLDKLRARGLLSDQRMAEALVRTRGARYGRLRIAQELERRGVDRETIAASLPSEADEVRTAREVWRRKFGGPPANLQERARQARYLAARGFCAAVVGRVLAGADAVD